MRIKLFGAFIAALAIAAFAALPASAMAEASKLRMPAGTLVPKNTTVRASSKNLTLTGRPSGLMIGCAFSSINGKVVENPGAQVELFEGGVFEGTGTGDKCATNTPRIERRVSTVKFRKKIKLTRTAGVSSGSTEARFTLRFYDREISKTEPVADCSYEGEFEVTTAGTAGNDELKVTETTADAKRDEQPGVKNFGSCDPEIRLRGTLRLSRRDGTPIIIE